jgi:hypothetical protein
MGEDMTGVAVAAARIIEETETEDLRVEVKVGGVQEWTDMPGFSLYAAGSEEHFRSGIETLKPLTTEIRVVRVTRITTTEEVELA